MIKRDPSKALQVGFLVLLTVSTLQVAYWIIENVGYTREVQQRFEALYAADAAAVAALSEGAEPGALNELFPHLEISPDTGIASVSADALAELERESARRTNQYVWEGAFFLIVLLGGIGVLTRAIRHDAELRRRQQNFLAAVSHEFKSPLASIQLAAETIELRAAEADSKRLAQRIVEDGERLLRMIDNLLDTTRLEEGRHELTPQRTALAAAVLASVEEIAERAERNGISVTIDVPEPVMLSVDKTALETILRNLLDNAVKACVAGDGREIAVHARQDDDAIELSVTDDGRGFAPEDSAMIFEKFHRLGDELRRSSPGTGLGLYIVRRLAELSGARIDARSDGPGRGATVTIRWPAAK